MNFFEIAYRKVMMEVDACLEYVLPNTKPTMIIGLLVGAVISIVLFWLLKRSKPVKMNLGLKLNLFLLPILTMTSATFFKVIDETETYYQKKVSENIVPISRMGFPVFQHFVSSEFVKDDETFTFEVTLGQFSNAFKKEPEGDFANKFKMQIANHFAPKFSQWSILAILNQAEHEFEFGDMSKIEEIRSIEILATSADFWDSVRIDLHERITEQFSDYRMKFSLWTGAILLLMLLQFALSRKKSGVTS
ncbi:MAG: hypothetical protein MRY83_18330 [Flavobacteriales bacterium]|nr:hypothetical protein [Flavobacteriales bacterium]